MLSRSASSSYEARIPPAPPRRPPEPACRGEPSIHLDTGRPCDAIFGIKVSKIGYGFAYFFFRRFVVFFAAAFFAFLFFAIAALLA